MSSVNRPVRRIQSGASLVELIASIVIIGVALAGVLLVMTTTVVRSADPLVRQQGMAVAEAYLEEISARAWGGASGAGSRSDYETVGDYDGLVDQPPRNQFEEPITGLDEYSVSVDVGPGTINGQSNGVLRIDVTVQHSAGESVRLSGYRLDY